MFELLSQVSLQVRVDYLQVAYLIFQRLYLLKFNYSFKLKLFLLFSYRKLVNVRIIKDYKIGTTQKVTKPL